MSLYNVFFLINPSTADCGPPSPPTNAHILPFTSTLEGATVTYVCCIILPGGQQSCCEEDNVTAVCNKEGYWEPSTDDICAEPTGQSGELLLVTTTSTTVEPLCKVAPMHGPSYTEECIKLPLK